MSTQVNVKRQVTGSKVLIAFVAFFAVVGGMNAVLLRAAVSTFGGVEVASAYRAGLAFNNEIAAAARQDARQWKVEVELSPQRNGETRLLVKLREANGDPTSNVEVVASLIHPADGRRDRRVSLNEISKGVFEGTTNEMSGRWDLLIEAARDGETVFRSRSRIALR